MYKLYSRISDKETILECWGASTAPKTARRKKLKNLLTKSAVDAIL